MIYYIADIQANAIKIGYTGPYHTLITSAQSRLKSLQVGNPNDLCLLAIEEGDVLREGNRQYEFKHLCIHGEWFRIAGELLDCIGGLEHIIEPEIVTALQVDNPERQERILRQEKIRVAQAEAEKIVNSGHKRADEVISLALEKANGIVKLARTNANEIASFARKEADRVVKAARRKADNTIKSAQKEAEGLSSLSKYRFDCRCNHCGMPDDTVCERTDGLSWCDDCWDKVLFAEIAAKARELGHGKAMRY